MGLLSSISRRLAAGQAVRAQQRSAEVHPLQRYPGYTDRDREIFKKFVVSPGTPQPGFITNEKPTRFHFSADGRESENMTEVDGTQIWMNPTL